MWGQDNSLKTQEATAYQPFWETTYTDPLAQCQVLKLPKLKTDPLHEDLTEILLYGIYHFREIRGKLIWNFQIISHKELQTYFDRFNIAKYVDFPKKDKIDTASTLQSTFLLMIRKAKTMLTRVNLQDELEANITKHCADNLELLDKIKEVFLNFKVKNFCSLFLAIANQVKDIITHFVRVKMMYAAHIHQHTNNIEANLMFLKTKLKSILSPPGKLVYTHIQDIPGVQHEFTRLLCAIQGLASTTPDQEANTDILTLMMGVRQEVSPIQLWLDCISQITSSDPNILNMTDTNVYDAYQK